MLRRTVPRSSARTRRVASVPESCPSSGVGARRSERHAPRAAARADGRAGGRERRHDRDASSERSDAVSLWVAGRRRRRPRRLPGRPGGRRCDRRLSGGRDSDGGRGRERRRPTWASARGSWQDTLRTSPGRPRFGAPGDRPGRACRPSLSAYSSRVHPARQGELHAARRVYAVSITSITPSVLLGRLPAYDRGSGLSTPSPATTSDGRPAPTRRPPWPCAGDRR